MTWVALTTILIGLILLVWASSRDDEFPEAHRRDRAMNALRDIHKL